MGSMNEKDKLGNPSHTGVATLSACSLACRGVKQSEGDCEGVIK